MCVFSSATSERKCARKALQQDLSVSPAAVLASVGIFVVAMLLLVFGGRSRLPPTSETSVRLAVLALMLGCVCLVTAGAAWLIISSMWVAGPRPLPLIFAIALLLPVFASAGVYFAYAIHVTAFGHRDSTDPSRHIGILRLVARLCAEMGIDHKVTVRFSAEPDESPHVLGLSRRWSVLILPSDIFPLASEACAGRRKLAVSLIRLVVAHELAHVRNGDVRAIGAKSESATAAISFPRRNRGAAAGRCWSKPCRPASRSGSVRGGFR